jgi:hypothetical protein
MKQLTLQCVSTPDHMTMFNPLREGGVLINGNVHTREQAEQLRDWLNEYLSQPTPEEIAMGEALRKAATPDVPKDIYEKCSQFSRDMWLRVAREAMKRGAK